MGLYDEPNTSYAWPPPEWDEPTDAIVDSGVPVVEPAPGLVFPPPEWGEPQPPAEFEQAIDPYAPQALPVPAPDNVESTGAEWASQFYNDVGPGEGDGTPFAPDPDPTSLQSDAGLAPEPEVLPNELDESDALLAQGAEQIAIDRAQRENEQQQFIATERAEALAENEKQAKDTLEVYEMAQARSQEESNRLREEVRELSEREPDPDRWWSNRSTGQKIAAYVSAIAGGILSVRNGGRNSGLELIMDAMDKDLAAQEREFSRQSQLINQEQGFLQEDMTANTELFRRREVIRQTSYGMIDAKLASAAAQLDPRGTAVQNITEARLGVRERAAKSAAEAKSRALDEFVKLGNFELNQKKFAEQQRARRVAASSARAAQNNSMLKAGFVKDASGKWIKDPNAPVDSYEQLRSLNMAEDVKRKRLENSSEERTRKFGAGGLKTKGGETILFRSPEEAAKVSKLKGATDMAAGIIDRAVRAHEKHGFSSGLLKSSEWRQAKADAAALKFEIKNTAELGVLAGPDMELIDEFLATSDMTEIRDIAPGLKAARRNIVDKFNHTVRGNQPDAETYNPAKIEVSTDKERTNDELSSRIVRPLRPGEDSQKAISTRAASAEVLSQRDDLGASDYLSQVQGLAEQVKAGEIDKKAAAQIAGPLIEAYRKRAEKEVSGGSMVLDDIYLDIAASKKNPLLKKVRDAKTLEQKFEVLSGGR